METTLQSVEALQEEAARFAARLTPSPDRATLVTLTGDLGAGKTSFTQGMAAALGVSDAVTSPTFVLMKQYPLSGQAFDTLVHIDAYRLEGGEALRPLGFDGVAANPRNLIVLEWPERVRDALPEADHAIHLSVAPAGGRLISYGS